MDTVTKTGLDAAKTAFKKVLHKTAEATGGLIGTKIAEKILNPMPVIDKNSRNVNHLVIPPKERQEMN